MNIGEKIAESRKKNNMTQRELAEKINVSDRVISKWETGKSLPDVETMLRLSQVLDVSITELYDCVEKIDIQKIEAYSEERVWAYKKYSIISCFLVIMSPILFVLSWVEWSSFYYLQDVLFFILIIASISALVLGLAFQISQFVRLYSYAKTKFYQSEYKRVLKKYGFISLACFMTPVLFVMICYLISLFI